MLKQVAAADEQAVLAYTGKVRLQSVTMRQRTFDAPTLYVQLIDSAAATIGTDAPRVVLPVPAGRADFQFTQRKVQFSGGGGEYFATGLSMAVTTTHDGSTAMDAGDEPEIILDFEPV